MEIALRSLRNGCGLWRGTAITKQHTGRCKSIFVSFSNRSNSRLTFFAQKHSISSKCLAPVGVTMARGASSGEEGFFIASIAALAATTLWFSQYSVSCDSRAIATHNDSDEEESKKMNAFEGVWWRRRPTSSGTSITRAKDPEIREQVGVEAKTVSESADHRVRIACIGDSITYGVDSNSQSSAVGIPQALSLLVKAADKEHILTSSNYKQDTETKLNLLTAVMAAQVEQLWIELRMDEIQNDQTCGSIPPLKKRLAIMAHHLNVDLGWGWPWPEQERFPPQLHSTMPMFLEHLLGKDSVECRNFGVSGTTMMSRAHNPYTDREEFQQALRYNPDVVVINLGFNDAIPANWDLYGASYVHDCLHMIDGFSNLDSKPTIFLCVPTLPQAMALNYDDVISIRQSKGGLDNSIAAAASLRDVTLIHLEQVLATDHYLDDRFHPNEQGLRAMADAIHAEVAAAVQARSHVHNEEKSST